MPRASHHDKGCYLVGTLALVGLFLWGAVPGRAFAGPPLPEGAAATPAAQATWSDFHHGLLDRLAARETAIADQQRVASASARRRARALYRLSRVAEMGFAAEPAHRLERSRASRAALPLFVRDAAEARALGAELERVRAERAALAANARVLADLDAGSSSTPSASAAQPHWLVLPVNGPVIGRFGMAREPITGVRQRRTGVQLLARGGEAIRAAGAGTVRRVERIPAGGHAVVVSHARPGASPRWTTIVTGLRDVAVQPGQPVNAGDVLGAAGRTVDGAAVVGFELWRGRVPLDPSGRRTLKRAVRRSRGRGRRRAFRLLSFAGAPAATR